MTKHVQKKIISSILASLLFPSFFSAQSHISTQSHQAAVTAIIPADCDGSKKTFFSTGNDGFLIKWTDDDQGEHYQITDIQIKLAAVYPEKNIVAVYESDSGLINRISVWDFNTLTRKYAKRFSDSVTSLSFSANGTYLIAGTATVDGAVFMRASNGNIVDKIKDPTGIISYASTSSSEKTFFTYSPTGTICYYNMKTGKLKGKFSAEQRLTQVMTFGNDMFLAGVKDNTLYVISALNGKTVLTAPSVLPLILADKTDQNLYYLENNGNRGYTLKELTNTDGRNFSAPQIIKKFKMLSGDTICCGTKQGSYITLGSQSGSLFRTDSTSDSSILSFYPLTENIYDKIADLSAAGNDFYFLTDKAVYQSSYDEGTVNKVTDNAGQTQITTYGKSIILWSKGTRKPVQLLDLETKQFTTLFTPQTNIQSLRIFGTILLELESNSFVNAYHFDTQQFEHLYSGAALQDAVIINNTLYIAKSSATIPHSPLVSVNLTTQETVPLKIDGNVIYSLNSTEDNMYGIAVKSDATEKKTILFSFNPAKKKTTTLLSLSDEDTAAFACLYDNKIYTNIGKNKVFSYNLSNRRTVNYNRSASLPVKIAQNDSRLVVLNRDGSVSWYNADIQQVLADWYLTRNGNWYEF